MASHPIPADLDALSGVEWIGVDWIGVETPTLSDFVPVGSPGG